jgi:hypothetical protein
MVSEYKAIKMREKEEEDREFLEQTQAQPPALGYMEQTPNPKVVSAPSIAKQSSAQQMSSQSNAANQVAK